MIKRMITLMICARLIAFVLGVTIGQSGFAQTLDEPVIEIQKTGQVACWDNDGNSIYCSGTGQDGELQKGAAEPASRCINNNNGTITDRVTGLTWLANNSCLSAAENWTNKLLSVDAIASGSCGLSDGSQVGDWRVPNINELLSALTFSSGGLEIGFDCGLALEDKSIWSSTVSPGFIGFVGDNPTSSGVSAQSAYTYSSASKSIEDGLRSAVISSITAWPVKGVSSRSNAIVPVVTTNQTKCWDNALTLDPIAGEIRKLISCIGTRADGELQAGLDRPRPRFRIKTDFSFEDRLTGLVWLDATACMLKKSWTEAHALAATVFDGATSDDLDPSGDCGLSDGSLAGDWRIPNIFEALSLMDFSEVRIPTFRPAVHEEPFIFINDSNAGMPSEMLITLGTFWTSTTVSDNPSTAYVIGGSNIDFIGSKTKSEDHQLLLVRDPF